MAALCWRVKTTHFVQKKRHFYSVMIKKRHLLQLALEAKEWRLLCGRFDCFTDFVSVQILSYAAAKNSRGGGFSSETYCLKLCIKSRSHMSMISIDLDLGGGTKSSH